MPTLSTLPEDIYKLFDPDVDHKPSEENLDLFCNNLKEALKQRLAKQDDGSRRPIRFSALGKPDRQVWYDAYPEPETVEQMRPQTYIKFLYGAVIEEMILFLAREAGHEVSHEQHQVEVDGVTGSIDAIIDGVVVDVKSASSFGYKKFENNTVVQDDPFGYVAQLSGYANVLTPGKEAAWIANDKVAGDICVSTLAPVVIKHHDPETRIAHLKDVVANPIPPERCYPAVPDGKSGNMKLDTPCSYCKHKFRCWPGVRTFIMSTGPKYLVEVAREPKVPEVFNA